MQMNLSSKYAKYFYTGLLLCAFLIVIYIIYHTSMNTLDSDASSELVLAKHLAQTGRILSRDWFYSTELRVLNSQLIYAPLFMIFDNFRKVRFVGAIIMVGIMWLSYAYLSRQLKLKLNTFLVSSAILILPTSIAYARITLYHSYYAPYISTSFLIIGLFLSVCNEKSSSPVIHYAKIIGCSVICFLSGLGGIRQLLITISPLCLTVLAIQFQSAHSTLKKLGLPGYVRRFRNVCDKKQKTALYTLIPILLSAVLGYMINDYVLSNIYTFTDYNNLTLKAVSEDNGYMILNGLFSLFGYNSGVKATSVYGILSVLSIVAFLLVAALTISAVNKREASPVRISVAFFLSTFGINTFIFFFTKNFFPLYYIPVLVYLIPFLAVLFDAKCNKANCNFQVKSFIIKCIVVILCLNSLASAHYITKKPNDLNIEYTGLTYNNIRIVENISGVIGFLTAQEYDYGFAAFWNSNIITEMTNDAIKTSTVTNSFSEYDEWLSLRYYQDEGYFSGKAFVLFSKGDVERVQPNSHPFYSTGQEIYSDNYYTVLHFDEVRDIQDYLKR